MHISLHISYYTKLPYFDVYVFITYHKYFTIKAHRPAPFANWASAAFRTISGTFFLDKIKQRMSLPEGNDSGIKQLKLVFVQQALLLPLICTHEIRTQNVPVMLRNIHGNTNSLNVTMEQKRSSCGRSAVIFCVHPQLSQLWCFVFIPTFTAVTFCVHERYTVGYGISLVGC